MANSLNKQAYLKEYRANNRGSILEGVRLYHLANGDRIRAYKRKRQADNFRFLASYKLEKGCIDCGYKKHSAALHFDHVRGEKVACVPRMVNWSRDKILIEISKCEIRCANCHAERTWTNRS